jgi:hypothetical protein
MTTAFDNATMVNTNLEVLGPFMGPQEVPGLPNPE